MSEESLNENNSSKHHRLTPSSTADDALLNISLLSKRSLQCIFEQVKKYCSRWNILFPLLESDLSSTYQSMSEKGQTFILDKYCRIDDLIIQGSLDDRYISMII